MSKYDFTICGKSFQVEPKELPEYIPAEIIETAELIDNLQLKVTTNLSHTYYIFNYDRLLDNLKTEGLIGKEIRAYLPKDEVFTEINEDAFNEISSKYEEYFK